jgi:hypothetical protein
VEKLKDLKSIKQSELMSLTIKTNNNITGSGSKKMKL